MLTCVSFFLMILPPTRSTRTYTLLPYTTLFRARRLMLLFQAQSCPPFRHGRIEHCCCGRENHSCANPKTLPHYVRTAIDGESLESFSIHFPPFRSEEHTSELQSLMRISYAVFCLKKKNTQN